MSVARPCCPTPGCPGKLVQCFREGSEVSFECPRCRVVFDGDRDIGGVVRLDLTATPAHALTLEEVATQPDLVALTEWERMEERNEDEGLTLVPNECELAGEIDDDAFEPQVDDWWRAIVT